MTLIPINTNTLAHQSAAIAEMAVSSYLEQARDWLATAVEQTGPEQIAVRKAEIATAAEATKQLGLSREIQLDAQEMVRRAEYALGKAIRKGQEEGTVRRTGERGPQSEYERNGVAITPDEVDNPNWSKASPRDFAEPVELHGNGAGIYHMSDNVEPEQFDAALAEAKGEGNVSRANVVRKIRKQECDRGPSRSDHAETIRRLAKQGWTSEQMHKEIGVRADRVREIAREFDIEIPADAVRLGRRRFNHARVLDNVTESVEVAAMSLRDVDPNQLDKDEALERLDSLTSSISALRQAVKKIKESLHD